MPAHSGCRLADSWHEPSVCCYAAAIGNFENLPPHEFPGREISDEFVELKSVVSVKPTSWCWESLGLGAATKETRAPGLQVRVAMVINSGE
jgi:hypothetical protein